MEQVIKENKMGTMSVHRLLITMSVPMIVSMLVQALYNIVDSIFVAKISEEALTAVSQAFPMQNLMIAVSSGTCVGMNAIVSRSLGEKDFEKANRAANVTIFLMFVTYIIFAVATFFGSRMFFLMQADLTKDNAAIIIDYGTEYLKINGLFSFGLFFQICFERFLQSTGKTVYSMMTQLLGAVINIILDPILIFGLFGLPALGVAGAAIATVAGEIAAAVLGFILNIKKNHELKFAPHYARPEGRIVKEIYAIGVPSVLMQSVGSVMVFIMNKILFAFSSTAVAVFGVYFKAQSFAFMPVFGLTNGLVPIAAYNYGAGKYDRIKQAWRYGIIYAMGIMALGVLAFMLIPEFILLMFSASDTMLAIGCPALRITSVSFIFAGFCIASGSIFQALGKSVYSLWISVARQLVVLLPVAYLMSLTGELGNVWLSFPIAEVVSFSMTLIFLKKTFKILEGN